MLIEDPQLEEKLIAQRQALGADHHDEVWEGVYFMAPSPNNEHQELAYKLGVALYGPVVASGLGHVIPGANLAGFATNWTYDYRAPDVVVVLASGTAEDRDTHLCGPVDFIVEITSPGDRTHEKIPFYSRVGVRELLIVNRQTWTLELYRNRAGNLEKVGESALPESRELASSVLPVRFRLVPGTPRPQIEIVHAESAQRWTA
jgi:Uma2 family endonuclease